jgi:hypothetical protein
MEFVSTWQSPRPAAPTNSTPLPSSNHSAVHSPRPALLGNLPEPPDSRAIAVFHFPSSPRGSPEVRRIDPNPYQFTEFRLLVPRSPNPPERFVAGSQIGGVGAICHFCASFFLSMFLIYGRGRCQSIFVRVICDRSRLVSVSEGEGTRAAPSFWRFVRRFKHSERTRASDVASSPRVRAVSFACCGWFMPLRKRIHHIFKSWSNVTSLWIICRLHTWSSSFAKRTLC